MSTIKLQLGYAITSLELQNIWEKELLSLLSQDKHFILKIIA